MSYNICITMLHMLISPIGLWWKVWSALQHLLGQQHQSQGAKQTALEPPGADYGKKNIAEAAQYAGKHFTPST